MSVPMEDPFRTPLESPFLEQSLDHADSAATPQPAPEPSGLIRFFDGFLQERNIKWMLGLGMLILFGSSLTLVRTHWNDMSITWQHMVLLGYTGIVAVLGHWSYHRLGLRTTGNVLHALTVLLIPLTFLAGHLLRHGADAESPGLLSIGLVALNLAAAGVAAHFVFRHLLRGTQPTFLAAYLLLCLAGSIVPGLQPTWWPFTGLVLWGLYAAGTVKVSRHVFWMTEERRLPRFFGFFPILLLGTQFLLLTGFYVIPNVEATHREWLGLACLLTAVPILLTAETVARVFEQRTGNLVRPLPWSVVLPLFAGLALSVIGLGISAMGMPHPKALVPSGLVFAAMMFVAARRTGKSAFVWAMLIGLTLSYNFTYTFFREAVEHVKAEAAAAVHKERLPFAFYGLTYLPLLTGLMIAGQQLIRRGNKLFAIPIERFVIGLTCLLQVAAVTDLTAIFPVSLVLAGMFVAQAVCFRNRLLLFPAMTSLLAASLGFAPFAEQVLRLQNLPADLLLISPAVLAMLLLVFGPLLDRLARQIPVAQTTARSSTAFNQNFQPLHAVLCGPNPGLCLHTSWLVTLLLSAAWCLQAVSHWTPDWTAQARVSELLLGGLLVVQALVHRNSWLGAVSLAFAGFGTVSLLLHSGVSAVAILIYATPVLVTMWGLSYILKAVRIPRVSEAYGPGIDLFSGIGLSLQLSLFYILDLTAASLQRNFWMETLQHGTGVHESILWVSRILIVVWAFDAARKLRLGTFSILGSLGWLGLCGAAVQAFFGGLMPLEWLPLTLVGSTAVLMGALLQPARRYLALQNQSGIFLVEGERADMLRALSAPLRSIIPAMFLMCGALAVIWLTFPVQVAGWTAIAGLTWLSLRMHQRRELRWAALLVNLQVIVLVMMLSTRADGHPVTTLFDLNPVGLIDHRVVLLLAGLCAVSASLWSRWLERQTIDTSATSGDVSWETNLMQAVRVGLLEGSLLRLHIGCLNFLAVLLMMVSLSYPEAIRGHLPIHEIVAILVTYAVFAGTSLKSACRDQEESRVWLAEVVLGLMIGHLWYLEVIHFGSGLAVYILMGAGFALWTAGHSLRDHASRSILSKPFTQTGFLLPLVAVAWGTAQHLSATTTAGLHADTVTLLLPAAFYFWRGLEERSRKLTLLSVGLFNLTLALLWHDLQWHDPQLYMMPIGLSILVLVELLSAEIPQQYHSPLRYVGALCILVSPTFDIVQGSWLHIATLMVASVAVALLGIGLRIRPFLYCGAAFLLADLVTMVVRGAMLDRSLLWIVGIALGTFVLLLGAYFEKRREHLLQRLRVLADRLEAWK